ncbi:hypothetical protein hamaS1_32310 [Moorella sp. Hama-1]|nr:hypothetical protein hamaS1_32310 [Moorella sp. Hama-1]
MDIPSENDSCALMVFYVAPPKQVTLANLCRPGYIYAVSGQAGPNDKKSPVSTGAGG